MEVTYKLYDCKIKACSHRKEKDLNKCLDLIGVFLHLLLHVNKKGLLQEADAIN